MMYNSDSDEEYFVNNDNDSSDEQDFASAHQNSDAQLRKLIRQMEQLQPVINPISSSRNNNSSQKNSTHNQHNFFTPHEEEGIARGIFTREEAKRYKEAEDLITLQAKIMQNASKPSFNQARAIEYINTALGATFIKNYITTGKGNWQVEKAISNDVTLTLQGLLVAKKSDCEWYKAKLIKGGIKESNIHFDECKSADGKTTKYKVRLTCVQDIELKQEPEANRNLSGYELFLEEMDGQIENIKTAQSLLQLEQQLMKNSPSSGCVRDFQNDRKLATQETLIKLFEQAKSQSNESNYERIQSEVYQKAQRMGYQKTHDKQEAVNAYHRRLDWT